MPRRLHALPTLPRRVRGLEVRVAATARARLLGLAGLCAPPACGLMLPRTRSVHTFGMRFALDLLWLDAQDRVIRTDAEVPPNRIRTCRTARAVIEVPTKRAGPESGPALRTENWELRARRAG